MPNVFVLVSCKSGGAIFAYAQNSIWLNNKFRFKIKFLTQLSFAFTRLIVQCYAHIKHNAFVSHIDYDTFMVLFLEPVNVHDYCI